MSDFIADMGHELRTPLTAVDGYSKLLLDEEWVESFTDRQRYCLVGINKKNREALDAVEDTLAVYWLSQGALWLRLEKVDLKKFVNEIVAKAPEYYRLQQRFTSNMEVIADGLSEVQIDTRWFSQAMMWLLGEIVPLDIEENQGSKITFRIVNDRDWAKLEIIVNAKEQLYSDSTRSHHMWYFCKKVFKEHRGKIEAKIINEQEVGVIIKLPGL
jgi:signal transduction histidine kinase